MMVVRDQKFGWQFQYLSIVLEGQKIYQFVEYIYSSLTRYFILQIVESLWPCSLYDQMCENTHQ